MQKIQTVCILQQDDKVLLGMKKIKFGAGKWNGFGGHVEADETIEAAAKREVFEEAGIVVSNLEKLGIMEFRFTNDPTIRIVHFFKAIDFEGEPKESDEMRPEWFAIKDIPYDNMWEADHYWFPVFLSNKKFSGKVLLTTSII